MNLNAARVLITGAAGGIGAAIAAELLGAGASVLLADMNAAALATVSAQLPGQRDRIATVTANLASAAERTTLCQEAMRRGVNVVINNAGVNHFRLYDDLSAAQIEQTVTINVLVPMLLIHELLPHLRTLPAAQILNLGSVFGNIGYPGYAAYSASKFAIRGLSEALRRELSGSPVRVHYLAPRATRTPINPKAVVEMNTALTVAMDPPEVVARAARRVLEREIDSTIVGWPEKLFARINAILPGVVDGAIIGQLPIIRRFARQQ